MKTTFPAIVLLPATLVAFSSCRKKTAAPPAAPPPAVIVDVVTQDDVPVVVENVAQTEAAATVEIRARVQGFLTEAPFREGTIVSKGDLLFQIDPLPFDAAVKRAEAAVEKAKATRDKAAADVARLDPLARDKAVSQQNLDDALAAKQVAEADLLAADAALTTSKLDLGYTQMRAPFDGLIGAREVDVGNYVGSTADTLLLATISTTDPMRAVFHIPETAYLRYQKRFFGDQAAADRHGAMLDFELLLGDDTVYVHKGKFDFADRTLDPKAGTLKLVVTFPNPENLLRPGQFCRVRVVPEMALGAVLVPQRAVVTTQSAQAVFTVDAENKVNQRPIETTGRYEDRFIVAKGLAKGERVVVEGIQKVRPGMTVNPMAPAVEEAPASK